MTQTVIMPFGAEAGREINLPSALNLTAVEMMGHRSDLQELAMDLRKSEDEREIYRQRAEDIERYAVIIMAISLQVGLERWTPSAMSGFLELAKKYNLALPDWMGQELSLIHI